MAHSPSAKKRVRTNETRREVNRNRVSRIRTYVKKAEMAIEAGVKADAEKAFAEMMPEIQKGVAKGVMHKNTAARKLARFNKRIAAIA